MPHTTMICSFWDIGTKDAQTEICALMFLAIVSWIISNISIHRLKQQHTNYLEKCKALISISEVQSRQLNVGPWGRQRQMKNWIITIRMHQKVYCTTEAKLLHFSVTKLQCVEMPNVFTVHTSSAAVQSLEVEHCWLTFWWRRWNRNRKQ